MTWYQRFANSLPKLHMTFRYPGIFLKRRSSETNQRFHQSMDPSNFIYRDVENKDAKRSYMV